MSGIALWLAVALVGGAASLARYLVHGLVEPLARGRFPLGTLAVNVTGSLLLGVLVGASVHGDAYLLAGTAAIGSYTTFSSWMLESERLARDGRLGAVLVNLGASAGLGVGALLLGRAIAGG
jgi:CrcB protein